MINTEPNLHQYYRTWSVFFLPDSIFHQWLAYGQRSTQLDQSVPYELSLTPSIIHYISTDSKLSVFLPLFSFFQVHWLDFTFATVYANKGIFLNAKNSSVCFATGCFSCVFDIFWQSKPRANVENNGLKRNRRKLLALDLGQDFLTLIISRWAVQWQWFKRLDVLHGFGLYCCKYEGSFIEETILRGLFQHYWGNINNERV